MYAKIPKQIIIGGQVVEVKNIERCNDNSVGECCICAGYIEIADKFNKDNTQTEASKTNTFYHEVVHAILDTMCERELSENEKFVSCFAGFLTDAMKDAYFKVNEENSI